MKNSDEKNKKISCVLFDLDGVLVDACEWHFESLNKALKEIAKIEISRHDHETRFNGLPTSVKLKMLKIEENKIPEIWKLKQNYTKTVIEENAVICPEKIQLLEFLKIQNIKTGCVTNSIRETAELMLRSSGQISYFDKIVTNEDVVRNKPFPDCYNFAIESLCANHRETLCIEDSDKGIEAAKNSFAKYVWEVKGFNEVNLKNYLEFIK